MAQEGFGWIYLIFFLIIPLSRIIPQIIRRRKNKNHDISNHTIQNINQVNSEIAEPIPKRFYKEDIPNEMNQHSLEMLVLGEINKGVKNFNSIQKNLGIETEKLDRVLQNLENDKLMKVQNKQGIFGPKIELIPTEKGVKKFYF